MSGVLLPQVHQLVHGIEVPTLVRERGNHLSLIFARFAHHLLALWEQELGLEEISKPED